ncbi:hypothetical protein O181_041125 [Austropuccinia psidii MF-1]|uniref:Reverse transcriptase RNase H-like domain-containing protein n=1 Tax=Austropuccinia psidii MF-1 TaxID=1389203 RepID=A0A9Q3DI38_9BASI|nr:hypothetical protein [Austropuccinia psidii MF-1]
MCLFHVTSVEYLGYVVSSEGLKMDQAKFQQILNWPPPRNLKALQSFLGFANSSRIIQRRLVHSQTDASDYALGAVLSKISDSGKHPIAFDSRKLLPAELNYEIHDKELLGLVLALKCWRTFLLSLSSSFEALTNHSSLQHFMPSKILTHRQACWAEFLSEFHFSITYRPGRLASLPDALSGLDNIYPEREKDFISKDPMHYQKIIKKDEIQASKFLSFKVEAFSNFIESIQKAL